MREATLTDVERIGAFGDAERTFLMTEEAFRVFYEQTARPVWAYLARITGDGRLADDLLQEAYYRFLRTTGRLRKRRSSPQLSVPDRDQPGSGIIGGVPVTRSDASGMKRSRPKTSQTGLHEGDRAVRRLDLARAMEQMKPRERSLLWLAYAQGCSHEEIAEVLGLKKASLKALLFRARKRLLGLMGTTNSAGDRR